MRVHLNVLLECVSERLREEIDHARGRLPITVTIKQRVAKSKIHHVIIILVAQYLSRDQSINPSCNFR